MKLRVGDAVEAYWGPGGEMILARPVLDASGQPRVNKDGRPAWSGPTMLEQIQGRRLSDAKALVRAHKKGAARPWMDREGNIVGWGAEDVVGVEIRPGNPEARHAEHVARLRELNSRIASLQQKISSGQATPEDRDALILAQAEAAVEQGKYLEFLALLHD